MQEEGITVLSLFDGMSCGQIALREAGIKVKLYFASEIDKHAIAQTQLNFPDTVQLGSVTEVHAADLPHIDLLIGGSPCQGFSFAGKQLNFDDPRSVLFFEYVRILKEIREKNPDVKFLLENVRMQRDCEQVISEQLGLLPVEINSSLVSAQNRVRLYWSNIRTKTIANLFGETVHTDIPQPEDRGLLLRDILEDEVDGRFFINPDRIRKLIEYDSRQKEKGNGFGFHPNKEQGKAATLCVGGKRHTDIVELDVKCCALRGRFNPETGKNEQIPELRPDGKTNCLTSVEKDNLICISSTQSHATVAVNKSTTLVAAMGMGGGHIPMVAPLPDTDKAILQLPRGYNKGCEHRKKSPTITSNAWEYNNLLVCKPKASGIRLLNPNRESSRQQQNRIYDVKGKSPTQTSSHAGDVKVSERTLFRRLTPMECARLQTIPEWYKWNVSETQQYRMLGNGWTVEVIKHIFSFL